MKRSLKRAPITLGLIGVSAFALAACKPEVTEVDAQMFPTKESCYEAAEAGNVDFSRAECDLAVAQAEAAHEETAPRYDAVASCEAQHGEGNCTVAESGSGGGGGMGLFMPIMMGYLLGKMMGGGMSAQPLTRGADGRFSTPNGQSFASNTGTTKVAPSALSRTANSTRTTAAPTATQARPTAQPMSQGNVVNRGGFGGSSSMSSSSGG